MSKATRTQQSFKDFLDELKKKSTLNARPIETIQERKYFLVVCEGERTEPLYFNYFKNFLPKHLIETIEISGEGDNTINIVKKAISLRDERIKDVLLPNFDEIWAVYDKDDFSAKQYNQAIAFAKQKNIQSGHSNQSFELWYVLHFQYLDTAIHRSDYIKILSKDLGFKYEKNDLKVVEYLFKKCNIKRAINWAKKLDEDSQYMSPDKACPSTMVYKLVEQLLEYCQVEI